jgi:uncharacterized protein YecE (DUF72 family)
MQWRIGTMGFSYADWVKVLYPPGTRGAEYLPNYAAFFDTVELDTSFHATPAQERVAKWSNSVPSNFIFCPKTPRQITHDAPIAFGVPPMRYFLRSLKPMQNGHKLGPILLQFPPSFTAQELPNLETLLKGLPQNFRFAVEFRHPSWETQPTLDLLKRHKVAWVTGDYGVDPYPIHVTTDFLYLRFIGVHKQFDTHDRERIDMTDRLTWWHEQVRVACDPANFPAPATPPATVYAFFNNDYAGYAPATADRFAQAAGLPARFPAQAAPQQSLF